MRFGPSKYGSKVVCLVLKNSLISQTTHCHFQLDDCCCGCGASSLSCACAFPPCLGYLVHLFGTRLVALICWSRKSLTLDLQLTVFVLLCSNGCNETIRVQKYIEKLTSKTKPKKVLVCMIYYPDEHVAPSWSNSALGALGYNSNPQQLQALIRKMFVEATS